MKKKPSTQSATGRVTEMVLRGANIAGNAPSIEVKTYGATLSFDREGDLYEAIVGRRSEVLEVACANEHC